MVKFLFRETRVDLCQRRLVGSLSLFSKSLTFQRYLGTNQTQKIYPNEFWGLYVPKISFGRLFIQLFSKANIGILNQLIKIIKKNKNNIRFICKF